MAGVLAWALSLINGVDNLVPRIEDVATTLWIGLIAAIIGAYLVNWSPRVQTDVETLTWYSLVTLPTGIWDIAKSAAKKHETEPALVEAILLTENLQRPEWVRRLERMKGRLFHSGTYRIMQVTSDRPLSDRESVEKAVAENLRGLRVERNEFGPDQESLYRILRAYNPDERFVTLAADFYWRLREPGEG